VAQADGQQLEPAVRKAINDFVVGCKRDNIWNAIKASCILAGARTLSGSLIPLKGAAPTNNGPFVSGDYNRETGLVGNGTSKYLDVNRANNADPQDNQHLAVYASALPTSGTLVIGSNRTAGDSGIQIVQPGLGLFVRSRSATNSFVTAATGVIAISRDNGSTVGFRVSGTTGSLSAASNTPTSTGLTVFRAGTLNEYSDARLAFYSVGEAIEMAALDTRVSALITAIGAAIP
jgi:hypothetical protein